MLPSSCRFWMLASTLLAASLPLSAKNADVDQLDQAALQEAFQVLKSGYIRQDAFSYEEINRAALDGLLRRLQFGAELVPAQRATSEAESPQPRFHAEPLAAAVGYVRFQTFAQEELSLLDEWLGKFQSSGAKTLILDLRMPGNGTAIETAARILDRFVNPNTILFKVQKPREDRPRLYVSQVTDVRWRGALVALIDSESSPAAELIAAVLSREQNAFLAGSPTPGQTVEYEEVPLSASVHLRFAVAEIVLGDGSSLFRKGLKPHFPVVTEPARKHRIFAASSLGPQATLTSFILDRARPRMNEAALVKAADPELDYYVARSRGDRTQFDQVPLQDETLQRTLDLLTTVDFMAAPPPPAAPAP